MRCALLRISNSTGWWPCKTTCQPKRTFILQNGDQNRGGSDGPSSGFGAGFGAIVALIQSVAGKCIRKRSQRGAQQAGTSPCGRCRATHSALLLRPTPTLVLNRASSRPDCLLCLSHNLCTGVCRETRVRVTTPAVQTVLGLNRASSTVSQDPSPAGTGANDAPGTMTTTGTVAATVGQAKVQASGTEPSHHVCLLPLIPVWLHLFAEQA